MYVEKTTFVQKIHTYNVDEIDTRCQLHQHFSQAFFADIFAAKKFKALISSLQKYTQRKAAGSTFVRKSHALNVDEIEPSCRLQLN